MYSDKLNRSAVSPLVSGGYPLLEDHRRDMTQLARVMARLPTSIFVGPGNAKLWSMNEHFDRGSAAMLKILEGHGVTNINAVEAMQGMTKRGHFHFNNTLEIASR